MLKISQAFPLCALILWLSACTKPIMQVSPKDLDIYAQNANYYLNESLQSLPAQSPQDLEKIKSHYLQKFFAPWNESPNMDLHSVFWMRDFMLKSRGWGENAKPYSLQEAQELLDSMRLESYPSAKASLPKLQMSEQCLLLCRSFLRKQTIPLTDGKTLLSLLVRLFLSHILIPHCALLIYRLDLCMGG